MLETGVRARSVAGPEVEHHVGYWLAGPHVDDLDVEQERDAGLALADIFPDKRAVDVEGPSSDSGVVMQDESTLECSSRGWSMERGSSCWIER